MSKHDSLQRSDEDPLGVSALALYWTKLPTLVALTTKESQIGFLPWHRVFITLYHIVNWLKGRITATMKRTII